MKKKDHLNNIFSFLIWTSMIFLKLFHSGNNDNFKRAKKLRRQIYYLKNHTNVKKVGTPQNFLLEFIDELWKTRKIRILKKWKKIAGDIIILRMCTKNHNHMRYSSWNTEKDKFFVILGHFFALYKTLQKCQEISSFYTCVPKVMIRWCTVPQTWCATDGRTDGRKKWHIEAGAPHEKDNCII